MIRLLKKIFGVFSYLLFDPIQAFYRWKALPVYFANIRTYSKQSKDNKFKMTFADLFCVTYDKYLDAGVMKGHYFFQDIWAAQKVFQKAPIEHIDVASRIDGFVAHILPFTKVQYVDIRKLESTLDNLVFVEGSILELPYEDNSINSLSCLHVIEHIGLGRYGDPIDPDGYVKAAKELARVLAPGGTLYLGTPIGSERLCFDAHRVFDIQTILGVFSTLKLTEFSLIDDKGEGIIKNADINVGNKYRYACGLFEFQKV
jgi:SAM-dependent methyltransferase